MDVRIGIVQSPKELEVELADDADREQVLADIQAALGGSREPAEPSRGAGKGAAREPRDTKDAKETRASDVAGEPGGVLWLTDRRGRQVAIPVAKIAYVEVGAPSHERRVGFGAP
ncbi:MAG: DUF3107 domain-containing protein [Actinomycetota bacterium]|jgi:hypothetical protein|nr:DUF3107 domain-containing protein [Actinomycetota bacterium]